MTEEEEKGLKQFLNRYYNPVSGDKKAEIAGLIANKEITVDQALDMIFEEEGGFCKGAAFYKKVINKFELEFGYYPVKVKRLEGEEKSF